MIKANIAKTPVIVFQNSEELRRAQEAIQAADYTLSEALGGMATSVETEGWNPESSRIVGNAAQLIIDQLTVLSQKRSLAGTHARIIIEDANYVELNEWPADENKSQLGLTFETGDGHSLGVQISTGNPVSSSDALDWPTGSYGPEAEFLVEARTAPLEIKL